MEIERFTPFLVHYVNLTHGTLSLAHWRAAFDAYALAVACTEQWDYVAAHTHKSLVLKVATDGQQQ